MGTAVICHLTSVHTRFDTRIFVRECRSLTKKYDVRLVVADGEGDAFCDGVQIVDVGKFRSRLLRIGVSTFRIFAKVLSLRPALVHIHDPELIVVAWLLKFFCRAHVVYDIHDDVRSQLVEREWVVAPRLAGWLYSLVEKVCASSFSLVLAELSYLKTYGKHKRNIATVLNYPDILFRKETVRFRNHTIYSMLEASSVSVASIRCWMRFFCSWNGLTSRSISLEIIILRLRKPIFSGVLRNWMAGFIFMEECQRKRRLPFHGNANWGSHCLGLFQITYIHILPRYSST